MGSKKEGYQSPAQPEHGSRWEHEFSHIGRIWGDIPGELAKIALDYMRIHLLCVNDNLLLDLGCGYGRDPLFIAGLCPVRIYGIDSSTTAINEARNSAIGKGLDPGMFHCGNFLAAGDLPRASVVYSSNVYQILTPAERSAFRELVRNVLKQAGTFFLSTLSINDPEHKGKGDRVEGEPGSFIEQETGKYLHLSTREEIARDFAFLTIIALTELEYHEPRVGGDHHHKSWILIGQQ
ncbi:MAG TPA: class I SAM-dependent methyltransferase [Methanoregulaceae archaeon]|nr:class I SAM-dependent methyltransferase [Methanoregulaceae archaeon]